ncbi:phage head closure protein [Arcobacter arenosus]|uniref:Head-tail adaptor protein n=1 Tax=Arcobacter arenosus TaxID=2576037 RepID=A0A5R8Y5C8_9BACT|nr:phage head closure protein [Arcobacter arenosus]TLP41041.1 head-tail adaptor protein [Arcobacter arenosus]
MYARNLRHRIAFQEQSSTTNAFNEKIDSWNDVFETWASIQTISGKEQYLSNQNYSTLSHKIRVRYSVLIDSKQRILFNNRVFKILSVLNIFEKNQELEILCEEVL